MFDELANMKDGDYTEDENIYYRKAKRVSLASRERDVTVMIEGEPLRILPATFEVVPNALTIRM